MTSETKVWRIKHQRPIEYEVVNCRNIFSPENDALLSVGRRKDTRRFVIVDANVERYNSVQIRDYFDHNNIDARILIFPAGEKNKSVDNYIWILRELDKFPINRRDEPIIAIGGGVLTDIAGFVASSYRRGVPHIKVPTTLMGYVDASIGIKAGINFNNNKNRLGAFEPPKKVFLDPNFLKTLPHRHILNGMCEMIKLAVIKDYELFELLESYGASSIETKFQDEPSASILDRSVGSMLEELQPNLYEDELARTVDFGHTFSYGMETHPQADLLHGEAVLIDILISSILAHERNLLSTNELNRLFDLVARFGIVLNVELVTPDLLWKTLKERTYHRNGMQRVPLPQGLGNCTFANDIKFEELRSACKTYKERKTSNEPIYQY
ncbi:MAG TPA: sedoheptulose 7-phosphate cyclase [Anaerolineales bacterium]|nr:sedoheptulose 7-phosphate cyclase [Anaerolineales bacterium]